MHVENYKGYLPVSNALTANVYDFHDFMHGRHETYEAAQWLIERMPKRDLKESKILCSYFQARDGTDINYSLLKYLLSENIGTLGVLEGETPLMIATRRYLYDPESPQILGALEHLLESPEILGTLEKTNLEGKTVFVIIKETCEEMTEWEMAMIAKNQKTLVAMVNKRRKY